MTRLQLFKTLNIRVGMVQNFFIVKKNDEKNKRERERKSMMQERKLAGSWFKEKSTKYIQIERKGIQRNIYGKER